MKPESVRAPTSARKQTEVSQQNPSGTAAFAPRQKSGCTGAIESCWPRHAKKAWQRVGTSMYGHRNRRKQTAFSSMKDEPHSWSGTFADAGVHQTPSRNAFSRSDTGDPRIRPKSNVSPTTALLDFLTSQVRSQMQFSRTEGCANVAIKEYTWTPRHLQPALRDRSRQRLWRAMN
jgi:hypothetical protein